MSRANSWSAADEDRLRELWPMPGLSIAVIAHRLGRTRKAVISRAKVLGVHRAGAHHMWTLAEELAMALHYPDTPMPDLVRVLGRCAQQIHQKARRMGIRRSAEFLAGPHACHMQPGTTIGIGFRFSPGHVPANKGVRRPGWAPGRMAETQFKRGDKPQTWQPIGTRVRHDGYWRRKVSDDRRPARLNWEYEHVLTWAAHHGPVPAGSVVVFRDGDRDNFAIQNLELISRQELMSRNTVHRLPPELTAAIQARGCLIRRINRNRSKQDEKQD